MTLKRPALETLALSAFTVLTSFLILDRWCVTALGPLSFGRVWQLYINYFDFGFVRRGLVGTILQATHLSGLFGDEYYFAIFVQHLAILAFVGLVALHFLRSKTEHSLLFKAVIFLSPTFILQVAYTTGSLDVFVLMIAVINIVFVRKVWLFSALLALGIFVHELFLFTIPAQLVALYLRNDGDAFKRFGATARLLALPILATLAALAVVALFGKTGVPREAFEAKMAGLIPHAAHKIDLWSGYFEVGSDVDDNARPLGRLARHLYGHLLYILVPLGYLATLTVVLVRREPRTFERLLLVAATLLPLFAYLVASDFFRWVGLSANLAILLLLYYSETPAAPVRRAWLWVLLAYSLLAPFGGAVIDNPFPAHKFILNHFRSKASAIDEGPEAPDAL